MTLNFSKLRKALKSLIRSDKNSRRKRIVRNIWLSKNINFPSSFNRDFRDETVLLEQEAQHSFIHGQFISTLLVSIAYCEHTLSDIALAITRSEKIANEFKLYKPEIEKIRVFKEAFWIELERLKKIRNAYAHRKWEKIPSNQRVDDSLDESFIPHKDTLTARTRPPMKNLLSLEEREKKYPSVQELIEQDAKDALKLMASVRQVRRRIGIIKNDWDE